MRAFLSYKYGDNTTAIRDLLLQNNIEVFDSLTDIQYGNSFQRGIKNAIRSCDFIVFIYSEENPNIAFEAGIAVGINKPIFSIFAGGEENIFLLDSTYVYADPNEVEKIRFGLELFLKNIKPKKNTKADYTLDLEELYSIKKAMPDKNYFDAVKKYNAIQNKSEETLEDFIQEVLIQNNIRIFKNPVVMDEEKIRWWPDFSIWNEELSSLLSNPINIEIKRVLNPRSLLSLNTYTDNLNSHIGSIIILYDRLEGIKQKDLPITSNRLFIPIQDLINELQYNSFASSIRNVRNSIIHKS